MNSKLPNVPNYQAFLESSFASFLRIQGASKKTIKNYLTDIRHFLRWIEEHVLADSLHKASHSHFGQLLNNSLVETYKSFLTKSGVPISTINRRLSSIRMFFKCAQHNGWIPSDYSLSVTNITKNIKQATESFVHVVTDWKNKLLAKGVHHSTASVYAEDVADFLKWLKTRKNNT